MAFLEVLGKLDKDYVCSLLSIYIVIPNRSSNTVSFSFNSCCALCFFLLKCVDKISKLYLLLTFLMQKLYF